MALDLCRCGGPLLACHKYPYPNQQSPPYIQKGILKKAEELRRQYELLEAVPLKEKDSNERMIECLKITPSEERAMVTKEPEPPQFDKCKLEDTVFSPELPYKVRVQYFPPHKLGAGYDLLPLVEKEKRNEHFKNTLSFSTHPTFAKDWDAFIHGLPWSRQLVARLPNIRNYHFHNQGTRYIEPGVQDFRKKMRLGPYIDCDGIQQPCGYGFMMFRTTKLSTYEKPKKIEMNRITNATRSNEISTQKVSVSDNCPMVCCV